MTRVKTISITGADRSGTTLMHLLMGAGFEETEITAEEVSGVRLEALDEQVLVSKKNI